MERRRNREAANERAAARKAEAARIAAAKIAGKNGQPPPRVDPWAPTDDQRAAISVMRAHGISIETIARALKKDTKTLMKYCSVELAHGPDDLRARMGLTLVQRALDKNAPGSTSCLIHWLTRFGGPEWKAKDSDELAPLSDVIARLRAIADQAATEAIDRGLSPHDVGRRTARPLPN